MFRRQIGRISKHPMSWMTLASSKYSITSWTLKSFTSTRLCSNIRENIDETYPQLRTVIKEGVDVAASKGKKALIIVGENHNEDSKYPLQMMILTISKESPFHFNDLFLEFTENRLNKYVNSVEVHLKKYPFGSDECNDAIESYILLKDKLNMRIHPMELPRTEDIEKTYENKLTRLEITKMMTTPEMMDERDSYMAKQLIESKANAVAFVGLAHMKGIMTNSLLLENYHPIAFNISFINPLSFTDPTHPNYEQRKFAFDPKNTTRVLPEMSFFTKGRYSQVLKYCKDKLDEHNQKRQIKLI